MATTVAPSPPPPPESARGLAYSNLSVNYAEDSRAYTAAQARHGSSGYAYNQVNQIEIPLAPGQYYLSIGESHMMMDVAITPGTGEVGTRLSKIGAVGLFRTIILRVQGGAEVIRMEYYNIIHALMAKYYASQWMHSAGRRYGYGTESQRMADAARTKRYEVDLSLFALFTARFHVPMFAVGLELVFQLENPINSLVYDVAGATLPTYTINNVTMFQELISGSEGIDQIVVGTLAGGDPILLAMHLYSYQPQVLSTSEVVVTKSVPFYSGQVTGVSCYFIPQLAYSSGLYEVFDKTVNPGLRTLQLQVGSEYIPPQPINVNAYNGATGPSEVLALIENFAYRGDSPIGARFQGDAFGAGVPSGTGDNIVTIDSEFFFAIPTGSARDSDRGGGINTASPPVVINILMALNKALSTNLAMNVIFSSKVTMALGLTGARLVV